MSVEREAVPVMGRVIESMESRFPEQTIARAVLSALGAEGIVVVRASDLKPPEIEHAMKALEAGLYGEAWQALRSLQKRMEEK